MLDLFAQDETPEALRDAVKRLVDCKHAEDAVLAAHRRAVGPLLFPHATGGEPLNPWEFFQSCFPFTEPDTTPYTGTTALTAAPTARTLGCSWRWRPEDVPEHERSALIQKLQTPPKSLDDAAYFWVRPLGLFVPHEGKNRVDFFRAHGVSTIPAFVFTQDYPAAARLRIYKASLGGRDEEWVVLDQRWLQRAPVLFHRALPVLRAYGVAAATPWPPTYPAATQVGEALARVRARDRLHADAAVDLHALTADETADEDEVCCAVMDLNNTATRAGCRWLSASAGVIGFAGLATLPSHWLDARIAAALALGASCGAFAVLQAPILRTKRRLLNPNTAHRTRRASEPH